MPTFPRRSCCDWDHGEPRTFRVFQHNRPEADISSLGPVSAKSRYCPPLTSVGQSLCRLAAHHLAARTEPTKAIAKESTKASSQKRQYPGYENEYAISCKAVRGVRASRKYRATSGPYSANRASDIWATNLVASTALYVTKPKLTADARTAAATALRIKVDLAIKRRRSALGRKQTLAVRSHIGHKRLYPVIRFVRSRIVA